MSRFRCLRTVALAAGGFAFLLPLAGCSGVTYAPVKGKVMLKNKQPLTFGVVVFMPDKDNQYRKIARGRVLEDGTYELDTDGKAGAPVGPYIVCVRGPNRRINGKDPPPLPFSMRYTNADDSPLKVKVVVDPAPGAYDFELSGGN